MKEILICGNKKYDYKLFDFGSKAFVVFFPDWEGSKTDYAHRKAKQLAKNIQGRVLLTDLYGTGMQPQTYVGRADAFIRKTLSQPLTLRKTLADLLPIYSEVLKVDMQKISFVGVCFGGSIAFEAGRANIGIDAVVSIHGTPSSLEPLTAPVSSRFLLVQGSSDPHIPLSNVSQFISEMDSSRNCWQMLMLGGVQHSFTKEEIGFGGYGSRFNQYANDQSLHAAIEFIQGERHE